MYVADEDLCGQNIPHLSFYIILSEIPLQLYVIATRTAKRALETCRDMPMYYAMKALHDTTI